MTKSERLLQIIRILHKRKYAITARELSEEFGISLRSVYRDIASLEQQGIPIEGEAGVGYIMRNGYTLPPLMFNVEELEALLIGAKWVASTGDETLATASKDAMRKIKDVIPRAAQQVFDESALIVGYKAKATIDKNLIQTVRKSITNNRKIIISYTDKDGNKSKRTIWPIAIGYFDSALVIAAWCELRNSFRHFRADRVVSWSKTHDTYPLTQNLLFRKWLNDQGINHADYEL